MNMAKMRVQEKVGGVAPVLQIMQQIQNTNAAVRRSMTLKYKLEF